MCCSGTAPVSYVEQRRGLLAEVTSELACGQQTLGLCLPSLPFFLHDGSSQTGAPCLWGTQTVQPQTHILQLITTERFCGPARPGSCVYLYGLGVGICHQKQKGVQGRQK